MNWILGVFGAAGLALCIAGCAACAADFVRGVRNIMRGSERAGNKQ